MIEELKIEDKHVISILVDNEFGALARIVNLFSARGYNIETLSVSVVDQKKNLSRVTVTTYGNQSTVNLIIKLLERIVPVHKAVDLSSDSPYAERGVLLIKVRITEENRDEVVRLGNIYEAKLVDKEKNYFLLQVTGDSKTLDRFEQIMQPFGILQISRTGSAALSLGDKKLD